MKGEETSEEKAESFTQIRGEKGKEGDGKEELGGGGRRVG